MNESRKIKGLQTQLAQARTDLDLLKIHISNKQKEQQQKIAHIRKLEDKISRSSNNNVLKVTEHAILRYLERVNKLDLSEIEKQIMTPTLQTLVDTCGGNGKFPVGNNMKVVIKDYMIVSIITED